MCGTILNSDSTNDMKSNNRHPFASEVLPTILMGVLGRFPNKCVAGAKQVENYSSTSMDATSNCVTTLHTTLQQHTHSIIPSNLASLKRKRTMSSDFFVDKNIFGQGPLIRSKKRVRFSSLSDGSSNEQYHRNNHHPTQPQANLPHTPDYMITAHVVELRPLCSEYSDEDKALQWLQVSDQIGIRENANCIAKSLYMNDFALDSGIPTTTATSLFSSFTRAYTCVFDSCQVNVNIPQETASSSNTSNAPHLTANTIVPGNDALFFDSSLLSGGSAVNGSSTNIPSLLLSSPEILQVLTTAANECARGLEDRIIPSIGIKRRLIRSQSIKLICLYYKLLKQQLQSPTDGVTTSCLDTIDETICNLSQSLTLPARRFGECMGFVDSIYVLMEYSNWLSDKATKTSLTAERSTE